MQIRKLDHNGVLNLLPQRDSWAHKGNFGRILLLCGSRGYTGAAYLATMGALRSGAGLVFLGVPESIYQIEAVKLNEAIVFPLPDEAGRLSADALPEILKRLETVNVVLMGCGLGQSEGVRTVVTQVLEQCRCPVVLDADGINVMAGHMDILRGRKYPTIVTPHDGEFRRLGGTIGTNRMEAAAVAAREWNSIVLLKGHETCITDGVHHWLNTTGNPGMAVGGSGDLLAGIIAGLLGQGLEPLEAAACGAFVHGLAGDVCAGELGQYGMLPTDMLHVLPRLLK